MIQYKHKLNTNGYGHFFISTAIILLIFGLVLYSLEIKMLAYCCFILCGILFAILFVLVAIELHQDKVLNNEALLADLKLEAAIKKKSFILPYNGGMIWSEHLDGLYTYKDILLHKLEQDLPNMFKPSAPSAIAIALAESKIDEEILRKILDAFNNTDKKILRVAFIGLNKTCTKLLNKMLKNEYSFSFPIQCTDDFEKAKKWLI